MASLAIAGSMVGAKAVERAMGGALDAIQRENRRLVGEQVAFVEQFVKRALAGSSIGPRTRSGAYARSIRSRVVSGLRDTTGIVGTRIVYARIHEYGHEGITPKKRRWLTIPTKHARSGRTRKLSARAIGGLRFQPTRRPNLALLKNQAGDVVFWLVKRSPREGRFPRRRMWQIAVRALHRRVRRMYPRRLQLTLDKATR